MARFRRTFFVVPALVGFAIWSCASSRSGDEGLSQEGGEGTVAALQASAASPPSGAPEDAVLASDDRAVDVDATAREIQEKYSSDAVKGCPGIQMASTCGNFRCDGLVGENESSCPADCKHHKVGAYNNLPICPQYQAVVAPRTVDEVRQHVRKAVREGRRVHVVGAKHSASGVICGDGVAISMENMGRVEDSEIKGNVVFTPAGVLMKDLGPYLYERGYSVGYTHLGFNGVTVAGAIGTAAHGSSPVHNNALSHRIASLEVVGPDGEVRTYERNSTPEYLWRSLQANLGVLGIITRVGLYLDPAINLDTQVDFLDEDALFGAEGILGLIRGCDWAEMNWFPGQKKVVRWCARETKAPADPNAHNVLLDPGVPASLVPVAKGLFHASTCSTGISCLLERVRVAGLEWKPPIVTLDEKGKTIHTDHAVGRGPEMMSASLIDLGKNVYFQMDWEVAVPQKHIQSTLEIARRVFRDQGVCLPGVGAFLRFGLVEKGGFLSYHGAGEAFNEGETALFFETPVTVPMGYSQDQLDAYLGVYRNLMTTLVERFGARAHWGKNRDELFAKQVAVGTYRTRMPEFNRAVAEMDPYGVFSNDYAKSVGVRWPHLGEDFTRVYGGKSCGCSLEAAPVCDRRSKVDSTNECRARCAGSKTEDLLQDTCDRYKFVSVPLTGVNMAYKDGAALPASVWR
jgi:UDP-N-acetylenolpyruvoylglucosamine reductase